MIVIRVVVTGCITLDRKILNDFGFSYVYDDFHNIDVNAFITVFRCRIHDAFKQDWYGTLEKAQC